MTLDQYSILLSLGALAVLVATVASALIPALRARVTALGYRSIMLAILFVAGAASLGAMVYQLVYLTPVCELCWWQRISLFPLVVIAGTAVWSRTRDVHIPIAVLSLFGLAVAIYHYWYHYQGLVLGNVLSLPCSSGGLFPACTESPILSFGFVTIPLMGIATFLTIAVLSWLAAKAQKRDA